jgi:peptidyl-prolyl cis-trans isomerase D
MALQYMRRHKDWLKYFFLLVIAAFIFLYTPNLENPAGSPAEVIGHVEHHALTAGEFRRAYVNQLRAYQRAFQGNLDDATLRSLRLGERVFESLVADRLVQIEAERLGVAVLDSELQERLVHAPELQRDGEFVGGAEVRRLLDLQGITEAQFVADLRSQLLRQKLEALITDTVSATPAEIEREYRRQKERVRIGYVRVDAARLVEATEIGDDDVKLAFEADPERYRFPERRVLSYLLLDREGLRTRETVTDAEAETYFRGNSDDFRIEEQVCASHVLIKVAQAGGEGHAEQDARSLAQAALDRAQSGEDFAALATELSEDLGSATRGGDLGCFERGRMVPEFDQAAFALAAGELSGLVRTNFGFHVIRVNSKRDETVRPFEEVKEGIRTRLRDERVEERLESMARTVAAALTGGESLEAAGAPHGLTPQTSEPAGPGEAPEPLTSPLIASKAFGMARGEIDPDPFSVQSGIAFIALAEVQASRLPDLAEVQERVRADLLEEKTFARARARAEQLRLSAASTGLEKAAGALDLARKETPALVGRGEPLAELGTGITLEQVAYELPLGELSEPVRVDGGYAVIEVLEKQAFDPLAFGQERDKIANAVNNQKRSQAFQAYMSAVRERTSVDRVPEAYQRVVG